MIGGIKRFKDVVKGLFFLYMPGRKLQIIIDITFPISDELNFLLEEPNKMYSFRNL